MDKNKRGVESSFTPSLSPTKHDLLKEDNIDIYILCFDKFKINKLVGTLKTTNNKHLDKISKVKMPFNVDRLSNEIKVSLAMPNNTKKENILEYVELIYAYLNSLKNMEKGEENG